MTRAQAVGTSRRNLQKAHPAVEAAEHDSALRYIVAEMDRTGKVDPLIVFLHGFPEFWYEWKKQLAEFSRDHTGVAPDMRGYKMSSKTAELSAYQIPNLVEDVRALT